MSSDPRFYQYGDLNPGVTSTPARQDNLVVDRTTGLGAITNTIKSVYESNNLQGLTRFKGIVLRDETDSQEQGFLDSVYSLLGGNTDLNIACYKVRIPEVHILPVPNKVSSASGANVAQDPGPHQAIIDMYPTFIAATTQTETAIPGDIVWVTFQNIEERIGPIYLGPIKSRVQGAPPPVGPDPRCAFGASRGGGWRLTRGTPGIIANRFRDLDISTNIGDFGKIKSIGPPPLGRPMGRFSSSGPRNKYSEPVPGQPWEYQITSEDVLNSARMIHGESVGDERDMAAVLWCMTSLFIPYGQIVKFGKYFNTMGPLLYRYSQPINPAWRRDGSACRPGGRFRHPRNFPPGTPANQRTEQNRIPPFNHHGTNRCSEQRLDRRDRIGAAEWHRLPENVRIITLAWAYGLLENPVPRAIEFADHNVSSGFLRSSPGSECPDNYKIKNWFIKTGQKIRDGKSNIPETHWSKLWPENILPRIEAENPPRREVHNRTQSTPEGANMSSGVDGSPTVAPETEAASSEESSDE